MADYVDIETARAAGGLRLVTTRMPGAPWTEAAKALFEVKGLEYARVAQIAGVTDEALKDWTGIVNAPIAVYEDERPRDGWLEILLLAERLAPAPRLIPEEMDARVRMLGLCGELMSEDGLIWNRRLLMFKQGIEANGPLAQFAELRGRAYGYSDEAVARAPARIRAVVETLDAQLRTQQAAGARFLIGDTLTALDLYWACACAIMAPLPPEQCPMPDVVRTGYEHYPEDVRAALTPALVAHRDRIYRDYLTLPIDA